ncbi:MAG: Mu-like prophage major head subunit gpT family protein [Pseudomonadota bacterium]|nr:Mu-like prophage major head subunit gpT family protein [Pseudomonadota bacterium]
MTQPAIIRVVPISKLATAWQVSPTWIRASARALMLITTDVHDETHYRLHDLPALQAHLRERQLQQVGDGPEEPLHVREAALGEMHLRSATILPATINEDEWSVEAVIATEAAVASTILSTGQPVLEVLRMDGATLPEQIPLLDAHQRHSIRHQVGSVRNLRIENSQLVGRLFVSKSEPTVWTKIKEGHTRDVSIGHSPVETTLVPRGRGGQVGGRNYQAPAQYDLHVNTRWLAKEVSLTPIGADQQAKIRSIPLELAMNERLRAFLQTMGLPAKATEAEAQAFHAALAPADRARADAAGAAVPPLPAPAPELTRSAPANPPAPPVLPAPAVNADAVRAEAIAAERNRVRAITDLAGDVVPAELLTRAVNEGWDESRASREFLASVRGRGPGPAPAGAPSYQPGIHSRGHEADCNVRALGLALMIRGGLDPVRQFSEHRGGVHCPVRGLETNAEHLRAADMAWQYRDMSLVDICREACRLDSGRVPVGRGEMIRAAVSGGSLSNIFTTNISAQLMAGYTDGGDTTVGWVSESDVPNFQTNERVQMGKFGALTKHGRGGTADHLGTSDSKEEYKIARYSGQWVLDEMDIIDDRLGAVDQVSPQDIGLTARQLRPNLVYAILLANAALGADNVALFHATHANATTGALAAATLQTAIQMMAKQRINGRPLNLRPRYLIVPQDLSFAAEILLTSAERVISTSDGGTKNPLLSRGIMLRSDDRIGVAGVTDPVSGTAKVGTATNYFLAAQPGEEGAKTIEVGYLRSTGRAPQLRSFVLTQGQWGVGWDINMDIGAKALDFRGVVKSTGA